MDLNLPRNVDVCAYCSCASACLLFICGYDFNHLAAKNTAICWKGRKEINFSDMVI